MRMPQWSLTKTLALISISVIQIYGDCRSVMITPYRHHFLQKVDLTPYKKIYHIGDTIRFEFTGTGKMLFDTITNSFVKADSVGFVVRTGMARLNKFEGAGRIRPEHFFTSSDGTNFALTATDLDFGVTWFYTRVTACGAGPDLHFSAGIIPRYAGVYEVDLFSEHDAYNCYSGVNSRADIDFVFNLQDCNGDLVTSMGDSLKISPADTADYTRLAAQKKIFFFRVE